MAMATTDIPARPMTMPIVVMGSATCEDTAITRSRLASLGVPYEYLDIDVDPDAARRTASLNGGRRVTPTVVVGDDRHAAEPTVERVNELVRAAGHDPSVPTATQLHGEMIERAIPIRALRRPGSGEFSIGQLRGRRQVALFLGHGAGCLPCFGYARQLGLQSEALAEADATPVIVLSGNADDATKWRPHVAAQAEVVADPGGSWKRAVAAATGVSDGGAIVLVLDRYLAPRAVSAAPEAGGLIGPSEVTEWHRFIALDCPECSGELPWGIESEV
jgi:glutaredoxin